MEVVAAEPTPCATWEGRGSRRTKIPSIPPKRGRVVFQKPSAKSGQAATGVSQCKDRYQTSSRLHDRRIRNPLREIRQQENLLIPVHFRLAKSGGSSRGVQEGSDAGGGPSR